MRVLFVNPVECGSGETVTTLHMARSLVAGGHDVRFLASAFAEQFIGSSFPNAVDHLGKHGPANVDAWNESLAKFQPDAIIFADYPMLFIEDGVAPMALESRWTDQLNDVEAALLTLDHFGFAQREASMLFGVPHLGLRYQHFPAPPARMHVLLPCPMHDPVAVADRRGSPFRYWDLPLGVPHDKRVAIRARYLERNDELLIVHAVSTWACQSVRRLRLPLYDYWCALLEHYLREIARPVTVVSVNDGSLLRSPPDGRLKLVNLPPLSVDAFEALLFSCDLFVTENRASISLGKAVCALQPCASLVNSYSLFEVLGGTSESGRTIVQSMERHRMGSVYRHDAYPSAIVDLLDDLILYRGGALTSAFRTIELYGGDQTARDLTATLCDAGQRDALRHDQEAYVESVRKLPDASQLLESICRVEVVSERG